MGSLAIITAKGVRGFLTNDVVMINTEDASRGFGFVTVAKKEYKILATSGKKIYENEAVRWNRVTKYFKEIADTLKWCKEHNPKQFTQQMQNDYDALVENNFRPEYISESLIYMLANKANNDMARAYQLFIAYEVAPTIRKSGFYGQLTKQSVKDLCKKLKVTPDEYYEYVTGSSIKYLPPSATKEKRYVNKITRLEKELATYKEVYNVYEYTLKEIAAKSEVNEVEAWRAIQRFEKRGYKFEYKEILGRLRFTQTDKMLLFALINRERAGTFEQLLAIGR